MALNKKGQFVFLGIMVAIAAFIVLVQLTPVMKDQITALRGTDNLDCDNTSISVMTKATCVVSDVALFYWFGSALAVAIGYIFIRKIQPLYSQ